MPALPGHMVIGRGSAAGPITGAPLTWDFGPFQIASADADALHVVFVAPCDLRIQRFGWSARTANAGTGATLKLFTGADATGTTNLLSGTLDLDANLSGQILTSGETSIGGLTLSTVAGVRDIAAGQYIIVACTGGGANVDDVVVQITGIMLSHASPESRND